MKQGTDPTTTKSISKPTTASAMSQSSSTASSRFRVNFKAKESPKQQSHANANANGSSPSPLQKPKPPPPNKESKLRRSLMANNSKCVQSPRPRETQDAKPEPLGCPAVCPVVDQFPGSRRQRPLAHSSATRSGEMSNKELSKKLELSQTKIKDLETQVVDLKAELDKAHNLNKELESRNKKLQQDLAAAAEAKESIAGEYQSTKFKDIQKLIALKLENSTVRKDDANNGPSTAVKTRPILPIYPTSKVADAEGEAPPPPPPPPPPPLKLRPVARAVAAPKTPDIVEFYHSLRKHEDKRETLGPGNQCRLSAHKSIVGEIQNRSAHLLAIKADIETKGDFINGLIQKVSDADFSNIEDVVMFVDWLDSKLSLLADERAVLKHFKWPERKADAIREAAIEYRTLKHLESEISSYTDDISISCGNALKKIAVLLDKLEVSIQRLIKLRNSVMCSYQEWKIPTDWMLDSGIVSKIKQTSRKLAKMYMKRVMMEIEMAHNSNRESDQETLLLQGVHFAYRAHQFAGGLDSETLCAVEEIRQRVPGHLGRSFTAIPSS